MTALFNNKEIKNEYFKQKPASNGKIALFEDSDRFKNTSLFSLNKNAIQLKLFIDAFTTTNVLGDLKKNYKQQGGHYRLNNLDISLQSKDYFTQLAVLFDNQYVEKYGYMRLLKNLVNDIKILEKTGIQVGYKLEGFYLLLMC